MYSIHSYTIPLCGRDLGTFEYRPVDRCLYNHFEHLQCANEFEDNHYINYNIRCTNAFNFYKNSETSITNHIYEFNHRYPIWNGADFDKYFVRYSYCKFSDIKLRSFFDCTSRIPANITYLIQIISIGLTLQSNGTPLYLTRTGALTPHTSLAIHIFFYENLLFTLDTIFGVGWYTTSTYPSTEKSIFALEQYSPFSKDLMARNFEVTEDGNQKLRLRWQNCVFGNGNEEVVWARDVKDEMVYSWFRGVPGPVQDIGVVELLLISAGVAIETSKTLLGQAASTAMLIAAATSTSMVYV